MRPFDAGHGEGILDIQGWTRPTMVASTDQSAAGLGRAGQGGELAWDPRCLRLHRLATKDARGFDDHRLAFQVVVDADEDLGVPLASESPLGQRDYFSARNRSTRFVDAEGRAAILPSLARIVDSRDGRYGLGLATAFRDLGAQPSRLPGVARAGGTSTARAALEAEANPGEAPFSLVWAPPLKGKRWGAAAPLESVFAPHGGLVDVGRGREGTPERLRLPIRWDAHFAIDLQQPDGADARAKWSGPLAIVDEDAAQVRLPARAKLYKGELWPDSAHGRGGDGNMQLVPVVAVDADLPIPEPEERTRDSGDEPSEPSYDSAEEDDLEDLDQEDIDALGEELDKLDAGAKQRRPTDQPGKPCVIDGGGGGYVLQDGNVVVKDSTGTGVVIGPLGPDFDPGFGFRDPIRDPSFGFPSGPSIPGSEFDALDDPEDVSPFAAGAQQGAVIVAGLQTTAVPQPGKGIAGGLVGALTAMHAVVEDTRQLNRAVFGDGIYEGNLGVLNRTKTPAASLIGQHVIARREAVKFSQRGLELPGILESKGPRIEASGAVVEVWREHRGKTSAIKDDRALLRFSNRGRGAKRSTGPMIDDADKRFGVGSLGQIHGTEFGALTVPGETPGRGFFVGKNVDGALSGTPLWQVDPDGVQRLYHQSAPSSVGEGTSALYMDESGQLSTKAADGTVTTYGSGGLGGATGAADNALLRADGTGGSTVQATGILVDDSDVMSSVGGMALANQASEPFGGAGTGLWNDNSDSTARPAWAIAGSEYGIPFVDLAGIADGEVPQWNTAGNNWTSDVVTGLPATGGAYSFVQRNSGDTAWVSSTQLDARHDPGPSGAWSNAAHFIQNTDTVAATQDLVALEIANPNHNPTSVASGKGGTGLSFTGLSGTPTGGITGRRTSTLSGDLYLGGTGGGTPIYTARAWANYTSTDGFDIAGDGYLTFEDVLTSDPSLSSISTGLGGDRCSIYPNTGVLTARNVGGDPFPLIPSAGEPVTILADDATYYAEEGYVTSEETLPTSGTATHAVNNIIRAPSLTYDISVTVKTAIPTTGGLTSVQVGDGTTPARWGVLSSLAKNDQTTWEDWATDTSPLANPSSGATDVVLTPVGGSWDAPAGVVVVGVKSGAIYYPTYV